MTNYEYLMAKSNQCMDQARYCRVNENSVMSQIWEKHAKALKEKANNLSVEQAEKEITENE